LKKVLARSAMASDPAGDARPAFMGTAQVPLPDRLFPAPGFRGCGGRAAHTYQLLGCADQPSWFAVKPSSHANNNRLFDPPFSMVFFYRPGTPVGTLSRVRSRRPRVVRRHQDLPTSS
jgi:hypothetical protein